ncbi:DNA-formamidopyrimidine glycosylase [Rhodobacteraceae bacterium WD3A24]|nr:DNA-formamidopyrimidine glycosylase [Rhodobacteraceae bacterium WD3A24]
MPELPEVETVRRGLMPVMEGRAITQAELRRPDLRRPFPPDMAERLTGARVVRLGRRSKYILVDLDTGETLIVHLGMSGRMVVSTGAAAHVPGAFALGHPPEEKHDHVILHMEDGARIVFNDARRFGAMDLWPTERIETHWLLAELGPEPLGNSFDEPYLIARLRGRHMPVKAALLDQRVVAGLGNIYVCEALHRAGVSPRRKAGRIAPARVGRLVPAIRNVLGEAIAAGGSTLRDHRRTDGELGYFQHTFRVYGREGAPCTAPGCTGRVRRIVQSGRSTFYCTACQR